MGNVACTEEDRRGSISFKADVTAAPGLLYWLVLKEFRKWVKIYVKMQCHQQQCFFFLLKKDFYNMVSFVIR